MGLAILSTWGDLPDQYPAPALLSGLRRQLTALNTKLPRLGPSRFRANILRLCVARLILLMACRVRPGSQHLTTHDKRLRADFHCLQVGKYLSRHHINTEANGHMDCPRFSIRPKGQLFPVARCWCDGTAFNDSSDLSALMTSACRILHDFPLGSNIFKTKTLSLESA